MLELLSESIKVYNFPFTVLLGIVLGYWLLVCLGALDFDHGHIHLHMGGDLDADADAEFHGHGGLLSGALDFLSIGRVPVMVVVSIMTISMWAISLLSNFYWNDGSLGRAALLIFPNLVVTFVITHFATRPIRRVFDALNREGEEHQPVVGRTGRVVTTEVNERFGQVEVETSGAPILINARTSDGVVLQKGDTAVIVAEDKERGIYRVVNLNLESTEE